MTFAAFRKATENPQEIIADVQAFIDGGDPNALVSSYDRDSHSQQGKPEVSGEQLKNVYEPDPSWRIPSAAEIASRNLNSAKILTDLEAKFGEAGILSPKEIELRRRNFLTALVADSAFANASEFLDEQPAKLRHPSGQAQIIEDVLHDVLHGVPPERKAEEAQDLARNRVIVQDRADAMRVLTEVFQDKINSIVLAAISLGIVQENMEIGANYLLASSWDQLLEQVGRHGTLLVLALLCKLPIESQSQSLGATSIRNYELPLPWTALPERYSERGLLQSRDEHGAVDISQNAEVSLFRDAEMLVVESKNRSSREEIPIFDVSITLKTDWLVTIPLVSRDELGLPFSKYSSQNPSLDRIRFDTVIKLGSTGREVRINADYYFHADFSGESIVELIEQVLLPTKQAISH